MSDESDGSLGSLSWELRAPYEQLTADLRAAQAELDEFYRRNDKRTISIREGTAAAESPREKNSSGASAERVDTTEVAALKKEWQDVAGAISQAKTEASGLQQETARGKRADSYDTKYENRQVSDQQRRERESKQLDDAKLRYKLTSGDPLDRLNAYNEAINSLPEDSPHRYRLQGGRDRLQDKINGDAQQREAKQVSDREREEDRQARDQQRRERIAQREEDRRQKDADRQQRNTESEENQYDKASLNYRLSSAPRKDRGNIFAMKRINMTKTARNDYSYSPALIVKTKALKRRRKEKDSSASSAADFLDALAPACFYQRAFGLVRSI